MLKRYAKAKPRSSQVWLDYWNAPLYRWLWLQHEAMRRLLFSMTYGTVVRVNCFAILCFKFSKRNASPRLTSHSFDQLCHSFCCKEWRAVPLMSSYLFHSCSVRTFFTGGTGSSLGLWFCESIHMRFLVLNVLTLLAWVHLHLCDDRRKKARAPVG